MAHLAYIRRVFRRKKPTRQTAINSRLIWLYPKRFFAMLEFKGISLKNGKICSINSVLTLIKSGLVSTQAQNTAWQKHCLFHRLYQLPSAVNVDGVKDFIDKLPILALALDLQLPYRLADLGVFDDFEFFHATYVFKLFL